MSDFDRLARKLEDNLESIFTGSEARVRERVTPWMLETNVAWEQMVAFGRLGFRSEVSSFRRGAIPDTCPDFLRDGMATVALLATVDLMLTGYRVAQAAFSEAWYDLVEAEEGIEPERRGQLVHQGIDFFFRYTDAISRLITTAYQEELVAAVQGSEQRRFHAIRRLLDGEPVPPESLGVELDGHHVGVVAWGGDAAAAARRLAAALERPVLVVQPLEGSCWAWISGRRSLDRDDERVLGSFAVEDGTRLALGLEAEGEEGFRSSIRQALRARQLSAKDGPAVVRYEDVAVEALAGENLDDARAFVARELAGIDDESQATQTLRETLIAYFECEHNAASAAAALGVHHQTVANRLRAAEDRLGHAVGSRRVELEMALRLRAALAGAGSELPAETIHRRYDLRVGVFGLSA